MAKFLPIIGIAVIVILAIIGMRRSTAKPMSPEQFMDEVRSQIQTKYPNVKIESEVDFGFKIETSNGPITMYLDNCYAQYLNYPSKRKDIINRLISSLLAIPNDENLKRDEALSRIMPSIKPREYFEDPPSEEYAKVFDEVVKYKYNDDIMVMLVIDSENQMKGLQKSELKEWNITEDEAREYAIKNLAAKTEPLWDRAIKHAKKHHCIVFSTGDSYDASRILLPDFYDRASKALDCKALVVIVPNRDFLGVTDADNNAAVESSRKQASENYETYPYHISPKPIFLTGPGRTD